MCQSFLCSLPPAVHSGSVHTYLYVSAAKYDSPTTAAVVASSSAAGTYCCSPHIQGPMTPSPRFSPSSHCSSRHTTTSHSQPVCGLVCTKSSVCDPMCASACGSVYVTPLSCLSVCLQISVNPVTYPSVFVYLSIWLFMLFASHFGYMCVCV